MCFSQPVGQEHSKQQTRIVKRRLYTKIGLIVHLLEDRIHYYHYGVHRVHIDYFCSIVQDSPYDIYILEVEDRVNIDYFL